MARSVRRILAVAATVLVSIGGLGGCGRHEFEDRTAIVTVGDARTSFSLDDCGRDGQTIYVVGRADDGSMFQAVMGLRKDKVTAVERSTGFTLDADPQRSDTRVGAFGVEAWERKGGTGAAPGRIDSARLRGSRIQFDGQAVPLDASDREVPGAEPAHFSFDARCDRP
ncbi:MAG: hypothetical protein U0P45_04965 [Acidimicrobiales bacterium]